MSKENSQLNQSNLILRCLGTAPPIRIAAKTFLLASFLGIGTGAFLPVYAGGDESKSDQGLACGPNLVCNPAAQYCSVLYGGPVGVPPSYTCADFPAGSPPIPNCDNLNVTGCKCTESFGHITVTCLAP